MVDRSLGPRYFRMQILREMACRHALRVWVLKDQMRPDRVGTAARAYGRWPSVDEQSSLATVFFGISGP